MRMVRNDHGARGYSYSLFQVDETVMISVIEGVQAQRVRFREDPKFSDAESQEFIRDHIRQLDEFLAETDKLVTITETGMKIH